MKKFVVCFNDGKVSDPMKKADAVKLSKTCENAGIKAVSVPSDGFISTMKYYYQYFLNSYGADIYTAYAKPSSRKVESYYNLKEIALNNDCRVLGHNCNKYTAAMIYQHPETAELFFRVETADNSRMIPLAYVTK